MRRRHGPTGDMTPLPTDAHFLVANAFEASRAQSMKRPTTGLKVRFFKVMIVTRVLDRTLSEPDESSFHAASF
jgi:hypothetical protein